MVIKKISGKIAFLLSAAIVIGSLYVNGLEVRATEAELTDTEVSSDGNEEGLRVVEGDPEGPEKGELPIELLGDDVEILEQTPQRITDFPEMASTVSNAGYKVGDRLDVSEENIMDATVPYTVGAGTASDYLLQAGEIKMLPLSVNPGVYIQAQLTQPKNSNIDYDLYILDANNNILSRSETYTYINGTEGTLQEAVGYITTGSETAIYKLAVSSSTGGSANEPFTLEFSVCDACDQFEPDENPEMALPFTFSTDGSYLDIRSLSSPIDNDWYKLKVPSNRIYDKLLLQIATPSSNTCRLEVYKNTISNGYRMQKLVATTDTATLNVTEGEYYVRIKNDKAMDSYNADDIQNYTFTVMPILRAEGIEIKEYDGNEGVNFYVKYPGYDESYFRTKTWISVRGFVVATDKETNKKYGVANHSVTALYANPYWEANGTPHNAYRSGTTISGDTGEFYIRFDLPPAIGVDRWNAGLSTQYYDLCGFKVYLTEQDHIMHQEPIIHYKDSYYN
ncbi:MAG: hypothetical protein HFI43_05015 [Lachnospiraceae bacterium]|nr:hypothetical protein [Lachnospiraceae bacterium]